jgi:heterodisulfide reductase subunit C
VALAHRLFIDSIRWFGRVFEPGLVILQNLRSGHLLEDVEKGPHLLLKHKLMLYPRRIRGVGHVRRIFANVEEQRRRSR